MKEYNPPVVMQVYLGSGKSGLKLKDNIEKKAKGSVARFILELIKKADPTLFKGVEDGKK